MPLLSPALLTLRSKTPCELWLDACVLHKRTTFLYSHLTGAQYSSVEWKELSRLFATLLLQHPSQDEQAASRVRHVMSSFCEVTEGVGDTWATCPRSHAISNMPCHGAWTSVPLSAHPSIECCCTAPQIETPICTCRTATHQSIWQQQHTCLAVGGSSMERWVGGQPHKTPQITSRHRCTRTRNDPRKKSLGTA